MFFVTNKLPFAITVVSTGLGLTVFATYLDSGFVFCCIIDFLSLLSQRKSGKKFGMRQKGIVYLHQRTETFHSQN